MTDLTTEQSNALVAIGEWMHDPDKQVFRLFGYAGTGKSTIAKEFASIHGGLTLYAAFTGKAALVLQIKGCPATTIHKLIYHPEPQSWQRLWNLEDDLKRMIAADPLDPFIPKLKDDIAEEEELARQPTFGHKEDSQLLRASLLVIDEVSMVSEAIGQDLLGFGVKILVLGDPAQLPPVKGAGFFTEAEPDYMLREVHRQAADSPVLALATKVRQGEDLPRGEWGDSRVVSRGVLSIGEVAAFDQVLVGTNRVRRDTNALIREELGFEGRLPEAGERIICLRNDYEVDLLNGSQFVVKSVTEVDEDVVDLTIILEEGGALPQTVPCWRHYFEGREPRPWEVRKFQCFDFGYAITVHKAQGSSWPNVLVIDQSHVFREDARKHLYTAITRASESVTVVR